MKRKDLEQVFDDMSSPSSSKSRRLDDNSIGVPSNAFQVFDNRRFLKRKELQGGFDDMSFKSRRLDGDLFSTAGSHGGGGIEALEQRLAQEQALLRATEMQQGGFAVEKVPLCDENDKALVLYNPSTTFYKTPASRDFSIIVNSDLIPGLRDHLSNPHPRWTRQVEDDQTNTEKTNGCVAIVPWVESNWGTSVAQASYVSEPMQAEEVEMMDTDDIIPDGFKRWQQLHCMQPQGVVALDYTCTPITW